MGNGPLKGSAHSCGISIHLAPEKSCKLVSDLPNSLEKYSKGMVSINMINISMLQSLMCQFRRKCPLRLVWNPLANCRVKIDFNLPTCISSWLRLFPSNVINPCEDVEFASRSQVRCRKPIDVPPIVRWSVLSPFPCRTKCIWRQKAERLLCHQNGN